MTADDYFAIQNLIYRYCDRINRGDFAGIAQLFAAMTAHPEMGRRNCGKCLRQRARCVADDGGSIEVMLRIHGVLPMAFWSFNNARCRLDFTVPSGMSSSFAIS